FLPTDTCTRMLWFPVLPHIERTHPFRIAEFVARRYAGHTGLAWGALWCDSSSTSPIYVDRTCTSSLFPQFLHRHNLAGVNQSPCGRTQHLPQLPEALISRLHHHADALAHNGLIAKNERPTLVSQLPAFSRLLESHPRLSCVVN